MNDEWRQVRWEIIKSMLEDDPKLCRMARAYIGEKASRKSMRISAAGDESNQKLEVAE